MFQVPYKDLEQQKTAQRRSYEKNKLTKHALQRDRRSLKRRFIEEYKTNKPCLDCGGVFPPCAMDFDHLRDKVSGVSNLVQLGTMAALLAEIEKCELVCANCHRIRTWQRKRGERP